MNRIPDFYSDDIGLSPIRDTIFKNFKYPSVGELVYPTLLNSVASACGFESRR